MKLLTNLIFEPKGKHDSADAYNIKDTVMSADGSRVYFALQDVPVGIPLDDEDYWKLQIDLSASKSAMDDAIASFGNYAKAIGTRVKGEIGKASGNPVTFLPDADSLLMPVTVLEPQQEGSGDPYPAGGGKNWLDTRGLIERTEYGVTFTPVYDELGQLLYINANGTVEGGNADYYCTKIQGKAFTLPMGETFTVSGSVSNDCYLRVDYVHNGEHNTFAGANDGDKVTNTVKEDGAMFDAYYRLRPGFVADNLKLYPQIELGSVATEYASFSNIRPFIGYDKLDLNAAGKNLFTGWIMGEKIGSSNGAFVSDTTGARTDYIPVLPSAQIAVSGLTDTLFSFVAFYDSAKNFINRTNADDFNAVTIYTPENCRYIAIVQYENVNVPGVISDLKDDVQIEYGASGTKYVEPTGIKLHTVQIGQTVYGVRFDWLTGKGLIEWASYTFTGEESCGIYENAATGKGVSIPSVLSEATYRAAGFCSHDKRIASLSEKGIVFGNNNQMVYWLGILDTLGFTTIDEFKAWLAAQNPRIVYKLATPIEIQLPPTIISAADPEQTNTLYGDGSIEVEYVKPLHVSIEERVAAALAAMHE